MPDWYSKLVDPRLGLVRSVTRYPARDDLPHSLCFFTAEVADAMYAGPWPADRIATGMSFDAPERSRLSAVGEAVERYCGNFVPAGLLRRSYTQLWCEGFAALDPASLVLYSEAQYASRGFPFVPFDRDLPVLWTEGESLMSGGAALLPASLVYLNYHFGPRRDEPATNFLMYSGIAAGETREQAEASALEELIERDATMIWWQANGPTTGLTPTPRVEAALRSAWGPDRIRYRFVQIPTVFDLPVIGCLVEDLENQVVGLGVACRTDVEEAALKAAAEAVALRLFGLGLLDPEGDIWRGVQAGVLSESSFVPYRADRAYMDDFGADFRHVIDLGSQSQIYLDPRMQVHIERLRQPDDVIAMASLESRASSDRRTLYLERLRHEGFEAYSTDITTSDVAAAGLCVVRVIVPGLYPNSPAAFPFLGGRRLYEEPVKLGWRERPLHPDELFLAPLPHT